MYEDVFFKDFINEKHKQLQILPIVLIQIRNMPTTL